MKLQPTPTLGDERTAIQLLRYEGRQWLFGITRLGRYRLVVLDKGTPVYDQTDDSTDMAHARRRLLQRYVAHRLNLDPETLDAMSQAPA